MELADRVKAKRLELGLNQTQLAKKAGIKQPSLSAIENGDAKNIRSSTMKGLARGLGVSENWLETGQENVSSIKEPAAQYGMTPVISWEHPEDLPQDQYTMIPRYEAEVSAGNGSTIHWHQVEKDQGQAFRNSFFTENGFKPNDLKAIYARGDSMEPRIYDGDSITIDTSKSDVVNEKLYVLRIEDEIFVKKLRKRPGGGLEIISLNPAYAPMNLNAEETQYIEVIGRVVQISSMGDL